LSKKTEEKGSANNIL